MRCVKYSVECFLRSTINLPLCRLDVVILIDNDTLMFLIFTFVEIGAYIETFRRTKFAKYLCSNDNENSDTVYSISRSLNF